MSTLPPVLLELKANASEALAALGETDKATEKLGTSSSGNLQKFQSVGHAALLGVGAAALTVGGYSLEMADQFEKAQARLEGAITNVHGDMDALRPSIDALNGRMGALGFTSTDVESALAGLTTATKNPTQAMHLMSLAADIARGRNMSLQQSTDLLTKVETGHVSLLGRLGIATKDAAGNTITQQQAVQRLTQLYGGDASRFTDTFAGKTAALRAEATNLATKLGMALVPILEHLMSVVESVVGWFEQHRTTSEALGIVIGTVLVAAIGAYIAGLATAAAESAVQFGLMIAKALVWVATTVTGAETVAVAQQESAIATAAAWVAANATMLLAGGGILLALAALAVGAYELYKHWHTVWDGIKAIAMDVWHVLDNDVIQPIVTGFEWLWHGIERVGNNVFDFLKTWGPVALAVLLPFIGIPLLIFQHFSQIEGFLAKAWHAAAHAVETGVSDAVGWVAKLPGEILRALGNIGSLLLQAGQDLVMGFIHGIESKFDSVKNTLGDLTHALTSWKGPPEVDRMLLHSNGQLVIQGFIDGLESKYGDVSTTLQRFTAGVPSLTLMPPASPTGRPTTGDRVGAAGSGDGTAGTAAVSTTMPVLAPQITVTVYGNLDNVTLDQVQQVIRSSIDASHAELITELNAGRR